MILLDQNISSRLVATLSVWFPGSIHVKSLKLTHAEDSIIWNVAKSRSLTILTKDSDFFNMLNLYGHPPKVIWLRCGNVSTSVVENKINSKRSEIKLFIESPSLGLLEIL